MRCPTCKAEIDDGSQYCDQCGSRIEGGRSSISVRDQSGQVHHFNSTVALISLLLISAALLILGGFWLLTWQVQQEQIRSSH
ncbi:MAG: zinc-ribbon domain-containing protein, partial [Caldilinea sp.]